MSNVYIYNDLGQFVKAKPLYFIYYPFWKVWKLFKHRDFSLWDKHMFHTKIQRSINRDRK